VAIGQLPDNFNSNTLDSSFLTPRFGNYFRLSKICVRRSADTSAGAFSVQSWASTPPVPLWMERMALLRSRSPRKSISNSSSAILLSILRSCFSISVSIFLSWPEYRRLPLSCQFRLSNRSTSDFSAQVFQFLRQAFFCFFRIFFQKIFLIRNAFQFSILSLLFRKSQRQSPARVIRWRNSSSFSIVSCIS